jgi:hypothetical protein
MNNNNKNVSKVAYSCHSLNAIETRRSLSELVPTVKINQIDTKSKVVSMKRYALKALFLALGTLFLGGNVYAGSSINFGSFPANGATVDTGFNFGAVSAFADYTGWDCNQDAHIWTAAGGGGNPAGGCWLNNGPTYSISNDGGVGCGDRSVSATIQMKPGALTACTLRLRASMDGSTVDETRTVFVRQVITLNNPGSKDDVDPDYTIFASGKTVDGIASTVSATNR